MVFPRLEWKHLRGGVTLWTKSFHIQDFMNGSGGPNIQHSTSWPRTGKAVKKTSLKPKTPRWFWADICHIPNTVFPLSYQAFEMTSFARRKCYPKTTIGAATADHPPGFETLDEAFQWADLFMKKLANRFGKDWLCKRLRSWRWTFSSAFSGVGAPESAPNLDVIFKFATFLCPPHSNTWFLWTSVRPWRVWSRQPEPSSHRADAACQLITRFFTNLLVRSMNIAEKFLRRHTITHATGLT